MKEIEQIYQSFSHKINDSLNILDNLNIESLNITKEEVSIIGRYQELLFNQMELLNNTINNKIKKV